MFLSIRKLDHELHFLKINNRVETMTLDLSNLNSTSSSRAHLPITLTVSDLASILLILSCDMYFLDRIRTTRVNLGPASRVPMTSERIECRCENEKREWRSDDLAVIMTGAGINCRKGNEN